MTDSPKPSSLHAPTLLRFAGARTAAGATDLGRRLQPAAAVGAILMRRQVTPAQQPVARRTGPLLNPRAVQDAAITQPEFSFASRTINAR